LATISQYPPSESSKIRQYANEGTVYKHLRHDLKMEHVQAVAFYDTLDSSRFMVIKMEKASPEAIWGTLEAAAQRFPLAKFIIAVDEDVNLRDIDSINLALCMRTQPHRDFRMVKLPPPSAEDCSVAPPEEYSDLSKWQGKDADYYPGQAVEASLMLIDATLKWPYPPLSLPKKEFMQEALDIWQQEKLPPLKLKDPWWGFNLGLWSQEKEDLARRAVKGEHYHAGELYATRKRPARGETA
ncbi:MAG: hypothetical protein V1780_04510, partial [Chloroflexota bacterium]